MSLVDSLLHEFDQEMANTRRTLERVPLEKSDWKLHPRGGTLGWLAYHVATIPALGKTALETGSYDTLTSPRAPQPATTAELLAFFNGIVASTRAALAGASDEHLMQPWTLSRGGQTMFTMPRIAVLRGPMMHHLIHHRGQLTMYLRMNEIPVPALYGPSADEGPVAGDQAK
jgi:uncharacterized damage-inducible protein DinB